MIPPVRSRPTRRSATALALALSAVALPTATADAAQLAAVSTTPGKIDVFTRDPATGQLRQTSYDQTTGLWTSWALRGGALKAGTEIAAVSRSTTSIDVFFRNTGDLVQRTTSTGSTWSTPVTVSSNTANGGPAAVVTGSTVQIATRNGSDGTFQRHTWTPSSGAVSTAWSNLGMTTTGGPGISATTSTSVQVATTGTNGTQPYFNTINAGAAAIWDLYAVRQTLPGTTSGTPAVTSQSTGSTDITARTPSGGISRLSRATQTSAWPTAWTPLAAPPTTELAGSSPATLAFKASSVATPALVTFLPTSAGTNFLAHYSTTGWTTIQPGYTPPPPPKPSDYGSEALTPGTIRYFGRTDGDQAWKDWFTPTNTPIANRNWLNSKVWRLEAFDGYAEPTTSWFSGGMIYYQLYTIDETTATNHPDWVLRDSTGAALYAADGQSPHKLKAGNIFNSAYRDYQVGRINALFADGNFRGVWLDNVNLEMSDSGLVRQLTWVPQPTAQDPNAGYYRNDSKVGALYSYLHPAYAKSGSFPAGENCTAATVPAGGQLSITDSCWATGIASFVNQIKTSLPTGKELLTNTPFYRFERNVETYDFYRDANNRVPSGLPTAAGRAVTDAATYVDLEMSFWHKGEATGDGPAGDVLTGPGYNGYSTDSIFRWIDAVHARGKGIVADSQTSGDIASLSAPARADGQIPLRIDEFNLAAYLLTTNGKDGIGGYNPTNNNWPAITGTGGSSLYDMNIGAASALPSGATASGGGTNGRGIIPPVVVAPAVQSDWYGNRLYIRKFTRTDGKKVFVLLDEASTGTDKMVGPSLKYTIPATGCSDMTRSSAAPANYRTLNPTTSEVTMKPRSAAFILCN